MSNWLRDVRYAWRALRRTPAFSIGAIVTVASSIGATTAMFSVVYGVLLRQLPYRQVDHIFWLWSDQPGRDRTPFNVPDFIDYRASARTIDGLAGFFSYSANLSDEASAERLQGIRATGNLFAVMGLEAKAGRLLTAADEQPGADHVVVIAESLWVRRFGRDRALLGSPIRLNGEIYHVVGVLPAAFAMPVRDVDFVLPFAIDRDPRRAARNSVNFIIGVGRLSGNASIDDAAAELTELARRLQREHPVENARKRGVRLVPVIDGIAGPFRTALLTLFGAVGAVLLVACANLANLMLARAVGRRRQLAIRLAIGSTRVAVVRAVLIEALIVATIGGAAGIVLAGWGVSGLVALAPTMLPRLSEIHLDLRVMVFASAASALTALLFGVIPALASATIDVREALQGSSRGTTGNGRLTRGVLVSVEVAIAVMLLIVMTILGKSFVNVRRVSPGFDASGVLTARLTLPARQFNRRSAIVDFQRTLKTQLQSLPGVTDAAAITLLPLSGLLSRVPFTVEGRAIERERVPLAQFRTVTPGYFEAARVPLKKGRTFSDADTATTRAVAVISEELASRWLQGLEPIGARLMVDDSDALPRPVEIVGVVGNVQQTALDAEPMFDLYLTYAQMHADQVGAAAGNMFWIIRSTAAPMTLAGSVAKAVRRINPEVVASQVRPMTDYLADAVAPRRFTLSLISAFGVAALALATTGIYAVVLFSVTERAREIAIRVALGARPAQVVRLVVAQGSGYVLAGVVAGVAAAALISRLIATMVFGVDAIDVTSYGVVAAAVVAVSVLASVIPSMRIRKSTAPVLSAD